jgi:RNA 3'-terminal phosphate cyclase (ATP)
LTLEIDGAMGEGGGQVLRVSTALSAILGTPIRIRNIRVKRSPPGLRPQHKTAVEALTRMSNASVEGLRVGSTSLTFTPKALEGGHFLFDTGTAGSTALVLQSVLPVMAFSQTPSRVEVRGGTNNPFAPAVDYLEAVFLPAISSMGITASLHLVKRGFYPRGGGVVVAEVDPIHTLQPITLTEFQAVKEITGVAYSARLPCHIVERMARSAQRTLEAAAYPDAKLRLECLQPPDKRCAVNPGTGLLLFANIHPHGVVGSDSLGKLGRPAETVGCEAAAALIKQLATRAPVDKFLGDQLIMYMALASGVSALRVSELTLHAVTCMAVATLVAGTRFTVVGSLGTPATITCNGQNPSGPRPLNQRSS